MFQKSLQREEASAVIVGDADKKRVSEIYGASGKVVLYSGYGCGNLKHHANHLLDGLGHMLDWRFQGE